jgi:YHS domain-containing protein
MILRGKNRLRILLMGAVAAGVFGPAQLVRSAEPAFPKLKTSSPASPAQVRPVAPSNDLAAATPDKKSEVMRQLELLYQKDGREMPEMNSDIKPVPTNPKASGAAGSPATTTSPATPTYSQPNPTYTSTASPAPAQAPSPAAPQKPKNPVTAFFKKLIPGSKDSKPTQAPSDYRPDVAPVPPAQLVFEQQVRGVNPILQDAAALPSLDSSPRTPIAPAEVLPQPLASLDDIPPSPDTAAALPAVQVNALPPLSDVIPVPTAEEEEPAATLALPESLPSPADVANAFTEMSETEADQKLELNPFTGLTLQDDAGSAAAPKVNVTPSTAPAQTAAADDPFADELKKMGIVPPDAVPAEKLPVSDEKPKAAAEKIPTFDGIEDQATREKMKKIQERGSMKGLKGFCPVTLRDQRELIDAKPDFHSTYRGQKFHFADADAKLKFDEDPTHYAPAAYGADVVALTRDKDVVEGSLDFAAWYKGRLYLFGTQDAHDTFVADPAKYATPVGIE